MDYVDGVATGYGWPKLAIGGRPRPGGKLKYVLLEEPGEPVLMHWRGHQVPHFRQNCPNCGDDDDEPKPLYYVGASDLLGEPCILELTPRCFRTVAAAARNIKRASALDLIELAQVEEQEPAFVGLLVEVVRSNFPASPRVLRCEQRVTVTEGWPFDTRRELARIWGIPVRPRLYREDSAG